MFDTIGLLYAIKINDGFYEVQYEHMKWGVVDCAFVFVKQT